MGSCIIQATPTIQRSSNAFGVNDNSNMCNFFAIHVEICLKDNGTRKAQVPYTIYGIRLSVSLVVEIKRTFTNTKGTHCTSIGGY